jgi:hypothetical protein
MPYDRQYARAAGWRHPMSVISRDVCEGSRSRKRLSETPGIGGKKPPFMVCDISFYLFDNDSQPCAITHPMIANNRHLNLL